MSPLERAVAELVRTAGPLTGIEIRDRLRGESPLALWQACRTSPALETRTLGRRYLRLDRQVEGYARLSPSILREFLTYSVIGLSGDPEPLEERAREVTSRINETSRQKEELARHFVDGIRRELGDSWPEERVCVILAGDIVYRMAHRVPRPERSTGELVHGSDIDLVAIATDDVPDELVRRLDEAIYRHKYRALVTPSVREEIDYVVKKMSRVREQLRFDDFKRMVACKILHEGTLLYGSEPLFAEIKTLLREQGVVRKLEELEERARAARASGQEHLLHCTPGKMGSEERVLFYSAEESEEFE